MYYIATAALVVMAAGVIVACLELVVIRQAFIGFINGLPKGDAVTVFLSQKDRDLLANFRRYKPREKKETVA